MTSINDLKADHKNARKRTNQSAELIQESIKRYGAARSIVIDEENRILAGNGTIEGAKAAGIKNVRIIETAGDEIIAVRRTDLTEHEKVGLALADNRTSDLSDWDAEMLHQLSQEQDISPWFDEEDLAEIIGEVEKLPGEEHTDPDDVPDVDEEAVITKSGDLWILGDHRLLCGDSTNPQHVERLMDGKKADMVFTDPPYGVDYQGINNDSRDGLADLLQQAFANLVLSAKQGAPVYIFHSDRCADIFHPIFREHFHFSSMVIWVKPSLVLSQTDYQSRHEPCLYGWVPGSTHQWCSDRRQTSIWEFGKESVQGHTTPKPTELIAYALNNSSKTNQLILDLFGGSGSTLIACERQHRHARLMELDPKYCDVIVKRWSDFTGREAILAPQEE